MFQDIWYCQYFRIILQILVIGRVFMDKFVGLPCLFEGYDNFCKQSVMFLGRPCCNQVLRFYLGLRICFKQFNESHGCFRTPCFYLKIVSKLTILISEMLI